ncbi:MAG TPA: YciI family protein [Kofleriaceae bacterium]|nr:YciI family protein [Kofleriaceae bacterium]
MHKVDSKMEAGEPPPPELIQKMGQLVGRSLKAGIFKDGAGLHRSATRARVTFRGGKPHVERGPYAGDNELIASFALVSLPTGIERAIELATELGQAAGGREVEVGPVVEGWDLNGSARPANTPFRFLLLLKGDASYEASGPAPAAVRTLLDRWKSDGLMQSEGSLKPSKHAARSRVVGGKRQWIDGPFAESKELIAGFSMLDLPSLEDVKRFTDEFAAIIGDNEIDVREVA